MKTAFRTIFLFTAIAAIALTGCQKGPEGPQGPAGQNAPVYYSEWFSPAAWSGGSGEWFFAASAPDLTEDIVERGVILAYVWLAGDIYGATTVRPLPAYAVGANWDFLIHQYGSIEFETDMFAPPVTAHKFRFIAIPGTIPALKSGSPGYRSKEELKSMSYKEVCKLYNIPE